MLNVSGINEKENLRPWFGCETSRTVHMKMAGNGPSAALYDILYRNLIFSYYYTSAQIQAIQIEE